MRWVLGLVGTGIDGAPISVNIMEFDRPDCLEDIASLGLTLAEGKQLLALVQQEVVVAAQRGPTPRRDDSSSAVSPDRVLCARQTFLQVIGSHYGHQLDLRVQTEEEALGYVGNL
jgi:hypothetical protein